MTRVLYGSRGLVYTDSGELTISLSGVGQKDSGWLTLPAGATGDIWIGLTERGGDGVADPALGYVAVSFK